MTEEKNEVEQPNMISFDGEQYLLTDLTPEIAGMFNMLLRINKELEEAAYIVQRTQGSQSFFVKEIKKALVDADIKPIPPEEEEDGDK